MLPLLLFLVCAAHDDFQRIIRQGSLQCLRLFSCNPAQYGPLNEFLGDILPGNQARLKPK